MKKYLRTSLLIVVPCLLVVPPQVTQAQTAPTAPVYQMLALVPDSAAARSEISYLDMNALVAGRPGATLPKNIDDWNQMKITKDPGSKLYNAALLGIDAGVANLTQHLYEPEKIKAAIGIDPFLVTQELFYGQPPETTAILSGTFDVSAIDTALKADKFVPQPALGQFSQWCGVAGCDAGAAMNMNDVNVANPFGGELGRKQPIAASSEYMFSSINYQTVQDVAKTAAMPGHSIADAPDYQAILAAFTDSGSLSQMYILNPELVNGTGPQSVTDKNTATPDPTAAPLPAYSLIGFAHTIDQSAYHVLVALVYDTASDAQAAGDVISKRLSQYRLITQKRRFSDLLTSQNGTLDAPRLFTSQSTQKTVLIMDIHAPLESQTPDQNGIYKASGLLFKLIMDTVVRRDTAWLAVSR